MKKSLLLFAAMAACVGANAQTTYNYFDPRDCDADGWLWFDTQAKLDKYCGDTSEFKIVLSGAQYEDNEGQYAECVLDPKIFGYNAQGEQYVLNAEGEPTDVRASGTWTGAIITPQAKSYGSQNGGGIMMYLPDLAEFSVAMSSEARLRQMIVMGSKEAGEVERIDLGVVTGFAFPFTSMSDDCQYIWSNIQNARNQNTGLTLESPAGTPVTAGFFNDMSTDVLIQGIKVFTYTQTEYPEYNPGSSVAELEAADEYAPVEFYNMQGIRVNGDQPGLYIRRQGARSSKVLLK